MSKRGILNSWFIVGLAALAGVALMGITGLELWMGDGMKLAA